MEDRESSKLDHYSSGTLEDRESSKLDHYSSGTLEDRESSKLDHYSSGRACSARGNEKNMDKQKIKKAVKMILEAIGENPDRQSLRKTPSRVAEMYEELFSGLSFPAPGGLLKVLPAEKNEGTVIVRNIPFYSMCEHHLLPFFGKAHIAYMPYKKVAGLSKFARLVDVIAARPQVQERITRQIASFIWESLQPRGIFVLIEATHFCMTMRGIKKDGSSVVTTCGKGIFANKKTQSGIISLMVHATYYKNDKSNKMG